ncbi:piggyBac transposable element-derived protein 4-like [Mya arenaria]|nr:piggyBac transposable element-derived protein 4-like [Mya arenaria]
MASDWEYDYDSDTNEDQILNAFNTYEPNLSSDSDESEFEGWDINDIPPDAPNRPTFAMRQSRTNCEKQEDVVFGWANEDSPPLLAPFTGSPGLMGDIPDDQSEIDCFGLLFDETFWEVIAEETNPEETNQYAEQRIQRENPLPPYSRLQKWTPVTVDELKFFIALTIAMGLVRKPDISDYFTNGDL